MNYHFEQEKALREIDLKGERLLLEIDEFNYRIKSNKIKGIITCAAALIIVITTIVILYFYFKYGRI